MDSANPQAPAMPLPGGLGMKFYRYRNLVRRHWWILLLTVGLGLAYEGYVLFTKPQLFESASQLMIREELIRDNTGAFRDGTGNFFTTAVEQLKHPLVAGRAHARIALEAPNLTGTVEISASNPPRTNIFTVNGTGSNPQHTQKFVDTVIDEFLKWRYENRTGQAGQVSSSLTEQEMQIRQELEKNKADLQAFTEKNSMQFWNEQQTKSVANLLGLKSQKSQLRDELQRLQTLTPDELLQVAASPSAASKAPNTNTQLTQKQESTFNSGFYTEFIKASQQLYQRQADYEEWKTVWKPAHPKLKLIVADIERHQRQINIIC